MRVALLTNFIPPHRLAFYRSLSNLFSDFVIFISTKMESNRQWKGEWEDLNVIQLETITIKQTWKHPKGFNDNLYVHFSINTLHALRKYKPDWIISGELGIRTIQAIFYCLFFPSTKLAIWATVSEYSEQGRDWIRSILRKWIVPQANIIFVNGASGEKYIRQFCFSNKRIIQIPRTINLNPYNVDLSSMNSIPAERDQLSRRRFLYVGQLIPRKGLLEFQKAFFEWADKHPNENLELWYVGDGILRKKLQQVRPPENVKFEFIGNIEYSGLPKYYQQCGVFIFPTFADEWGVVVNEAMAAGLPILGSIYSQAVEELVEDGITGWIFHPDRPDEIYEALENFYATDEKKLLKMGQAAKDRISCITPETIAKKMAESLDNYEQESDL